MRFEPLYRLTFTYPEEFGWEIAGEGGTQAQFLFFAEGRVEGRITGRFRGANHPQRRTDGTYLPDFQGVIETDDGATIYADTRGFGRAYPVGRRQIVVTTTHVADDERYRRLNDVLCVGVGEVRSGADEVVLVIEVSELIWEPIAD